MWIKTDSGDLVNLERAYCILMEIPSDSRSDEYKIYAYFPFMAIDEDGYDRPRKVYITAFNTRPEAEACMKGILKALPKD